MRDIPLAQEVATQLKIYNIALSIDDFGTGYSSLSYLKRFPLHRLKIDRSFVTELPDDDSDVAIVGAIVGLARSLNLRVIAEGVEGETQREFLHAVGCQEYQGYLCSPALSPDAFEARTRAFNERTQSLQAERQGYLQQCDGRRFDAVDEEQLRQGK